MKKTKKLVALVVTILMLATFATSTLPAFAETTTTFTVNGTGYNDFAEAVVAAKNASDHTVYLNKDAEGIIRGSGNTSMWSLAANTTIVINGNGHSLTLVTSSGSTPNYAFHTTASNVSITFQNIDTLKANTHYGIFGLMGKSATGCSVKFIDVNKVESMGRGAVMVESNNATILMENSNFEHSCGTDDGYNAAVLWVTNGSANVTVKNSNLTVPVQQNSSTNNGVISSNSNTTVTVNVEGNSTLCTKVKNGKSFNALGTMSVTLGEGVNLMTDCETADSVNTFWSSNVTVTDDGALYTVGANQVGGVTFPEGASNIHYVEQLAAGSTATAKTVEAGGTFTNDTGAAVSFKKTVKTETPTEPDTSKAFTVGMTGYATLKEAMTAVKNAGGGTIYLNADISDTTSGTYIEPSVNMTIDGRGKYGIYMLGDWGAMTHLSNSSGVTLTFQNLTHLKGQKDLVWCSGSGNTLNLINIKEVSAATYVIKSNGISTNLTVNIEDVTSVSGGTNVIRIPDTDGATTMSVNVTRSALSTTGGRVINDMSGSTTSTITLNEGAELVSKSTTATQFIYGGFTLTDNGAVYTVGATAGAVTFPAGDKMVYAEQLPENSTATAKIVAAGESFTNETGAAISFKRISVEGAFANVLGASIRTEAPYGIRFTARMDKTLYDILNAQGATFGIVIAPNKKVSGFEDTFFKQLGNQPESYYANVVCENVTENGDVVEFKAAVYIAGDENLTAATEAQLTAKMCACAYYTVNGETTWAEFSATDNVRSIYDVAKAYYEDTVKGSQTNGTINGILTTCGYFDGQ